MGEPAAQSGRKVVGWPAASIGGVEGTVHEWPDGVGLVGCRSTWQTLAIGTFQRRAEWSRGGVSGDGRMEGHIHMARPTPRTTGLTDPEAELRGILEERVDADCVGAKVLGVERLRLVSVGGDDDGGGRKRK